MSLLPFSTVEASPSPESLKAWLEVFLYLGGVILTAAGIYRLLSKNHSTTELANQPVEIKAHPGVVTTQELKEVHGRIARERAEINTEIRRVESAAQERLEKLETKIDENTTMTAEMKGTVGQMNQNISALSSSLTNFLRDQARH